MFNKIRKFVGFVPIVCAVSVMMSPTMAKADPPSWWLESGAVTGKNISPHYHQAIVNVGQAKWMVRKAYEQMELHLPGGAGFPLTYPYGEENTIGALFEETPENPSELWYEDQKKPLNVGQLKFLAHKFYQRFAELGFDENSPGWPVGMVLDETNEPLGIMDEVPLFPWRVKVHEDNAMPAQVGQLKHLFSFDLAAAYGPPAAE